MGNKNQSLKKLIHKKHPFLLLEVMIAFAVLSLSAIPLIFPHLMILKEERALIQELNFDLSARNLITGLIVDLYENNIPFKTIEDEGTYEVSKEKLLAVGVPEGAFETASFKFIVSDYKPHKPDTKVLYKVDASLNIKYSEGVKERLRREGATYPVSFLVRKELKNEENTPQKTPADTH